MPHTHAPNPNISSARLTFSIALTLLFVAVELTIGAWGHSLALVSDAGHNFADALALGLSAYALWIAKRPANPGKTFGYHRVGILAALTNAVSLVVIAILIGVEGVARLLHPQAVQAGPMIWVALAAIAVNVTIALWLRGGAAGDLNMRSAYLHMAGDAVASLGVVAAGVIVKLTGATIADPIVSLLIAAMILYSSWDVLKESVNVLLEGTPSGMDMSAVQQKIAAVRGVQGVHDLHVWTVGTGLVACSCHVVVGEQSLRAGEHVLGRVVEDLRHHFGITHSTIQIEVEGCDSNELYCSPEVGQHAGCHHH